MMRYKIREIWDNHRELWECIGVCFFTAFVTLIYFIIKGDGVFVTRADFNVQNIPFTTAMHRAVAEGGINSFSWNVDLGTSTIQGYAFYNLGSPFFWLSMLFPAEAYPYVIGWMYMLKYTAAGTFAFLYLKRFVKNPKMAIIGGLLYAFSGFSATNLMYQFHDAIAFFPLLPLGLERYMQDRKRKGGFIAAVALNACVSYFFFVQYVIFLCIYFMVRFWRREWSENLKNIGGCMLCGILGTGIAAPLFLPGVMHILLGGSANGSCLYIDKFLPSSIQFLEILKALAFPAELQGNGSALEQGNYTSTAAYLPMVGMVFVIAYIRKNRDWLRRLLLILFVMSMSPLLSASFLLFTGSYHRWWMAFVLMLVLATVQVLDRIEEYKVVSSAWLNVAWILGIWGIVTFVPWTQGFPPLVYREKLFFVYMLIALAGAVLCLIGAALRKLQAGYVLCGVSVFAILTTGLTIFGYQSGSWSGSEYAAQFAASCNLEVWDAQYRYISEENMWMFPGKVTGLGGFTSTRSNAIRKFDDYFDATTDIYSMNKTAYAGVAELLGGKYDITEEKEAGPALQELEVNGTHYYVYERAACPIGFAVTDYITEEELRRIPVQRRGIALLDAALVEQEALAEVSALLQERKAEAINLQEMDAQEEAQYLIHSVADSVERNLAGAVQAFERNAEGFACTTDYAEDCFVYFSVPFDKDWKLYIDGENARILPSGGMMLVKVPAGAHTLRFCYSTPFYGIGVMLGLLSCAAWAAYEIRQRRREKGVTTASGTPRQCSPPSF